MISQVAFLGSRSNVQCQHRWQKVLRPGLVKGAWTKEEDIKLREAVEAHGAKNWTMISQVAFLGSRSDVQCLHRWQKVRPGLVKGAWTKEEDIKLREAVEAHGAKNWKMISQVAFLGSRSNAQCMERWQKVLRPGLVKGAWTKEEDIKLREAVEAHGAKDWTMISQVAFLGSRSNVQCLHRWERGLRLGTVKGTWTKEEDTKLREAVEAHGAKNWKVISQVAFLGSRSNDQCQKRWQGLRPGLVKGTWTKEEDIKLREAVEAHGAKNWNMISQVAFLGSRSDKGCQKRWQKVLRPGLVKGAWTKEEDIKLREAVEAHGVKNWTMISQVAFLGSRSDKGCQKRWQRGLRPGLVKGAWTKEEDTKLREASLDNCVICFEPLCPISSEIGHLACAHSFHADCLTAQAKAAAGIAFSSCRGAYINCPLCRKKSRWVPPSVLR
eukprot:g2131.t1